MKRLATILALASCLAAALAIPACNGDGGPVGPDDGDGPEPRTYEMGFGTIPPRATLESLIETVQAIALRGELLLVQQEVPWGPLLDGTQTMEEAVEEREGLPISLVGWGSRSSFC